MKKEPLYHYGMDDFLIKSPVIYQKDKKIVHIGGGPRHNHPYEINLNICPMEGVDIVGNAEELPFEDESIDVIISCAVLEHVENVEKAIAEIKRVLKPDGLVYIEIPFMQSYHTHDVYGVKFEDYRRFTKRGLMNAFNFITPIECGVCVGPFSTVLQMIYAYLMDNVQNKIMRRIIDWLYYGWCNKLVKIDKKMSEERLNHSRIPSGVFLFGMKTGKLSERISSLPTPNSLFPKDISAKYELVGLSVKDREISISIMNTGKTTWIAKSPAKWGTIHLGMQSVKDGTVNRDYKRMELHQDVVPGDSVMMKVVLTDAEIKCFDEIKFDLVDEGICWFEEKGISPLVVSLKSIV